MPTLTTNEQLLIWGGVFCFALVVVPPILQRYVPAAWTWIEREDAEVLGPRGEDAPRQPQMNVVFDSFTQKEQQKDVRLQQCIRVGIGARTEQAGAGSGVNGADARSDRTGDDRGGSVCVRSADQRVREPQRGHGVPPVRSHAADRRR